MSVSEYAVPGFFTIFQLMAWIGTCVAFGGVLVTFNYAGSSQNGYFDHVSGGGLSRSWGAVVSDNQSSLDCDGAGKGLVAMLVFAFLSTLATLVLLVLRFSKFNVSIAQLSSTSFVTSLEFALTAASAFFYFLAVCIWGGACYSGLGNLQFVSSVSATGFAYIIVCFLLLLVAIPLSFLIVKQAKAAEGQHYVAHSDAAAPGADASNTAPTGTYGGFQNEQKYDAPQTTSDNPNV